MSEEFKERVYAPDEIEARLKRELPHWRYENGWIRRTFRTSGWKGTLMVINAVGHLAEAAWHHPDLAASYAWVEVKLQNHSAKGITDKDFELARKIEDFVSCARQGGRRARRDARRRPAVRLHQVRRQVMRDWVDEIVLSGLERRRKRRVCTRTHTQENRQFLSTFSCQAGLSPVYCFSEDFNSACRFPRPT